MSKIVFASDHAGFALKQSLIEFVQGLGFEVEDKGDFTPEAKDDYPDFIDLAAKDISLDQTLRGIIIGGSGQGEAIAANRFKGVRAALWYGGDIQIVRLAREHNDANILSLGARFVTLDEAKLAVQTFLETSFSNEERHLRRIKEIDL